MSRPDTDLVTTVHVTRRCECPGRPLNYREHEPTCAAMFAPVRVSTMQGDVTEGERSGLAALITGVVIGVCIGVGIGWILAELFRALQWWVMGLAAVG